jgi:hypothetical protein
VKALLLLALVSACNMPSQEQEQERERRRQQELRDREWNEPCHDISSLLATTTGSPDYLECPNKRHHMRVTVATKATNEEAAALVFCECERPEGKP